MFILENLLKSRRRKMIEWEHARDKWVSESDRRLPQHYELYFPRPVKELSISLPSLGTVIGMIAAGMVAMLLFLIISEGIQDHQTVMNATTEGKSCRMFNKGEHVKINSGDYIGATGVIVGGCNKGEEYQIKLDNGFKADVRNDGLDEVDVSGKVVGVESYKRLIVIES